MDIRDFPTNGVILMDEPLIRSPKFIPTSNITFTGTISPTSRDTCEWTTVIDNSNKVILDFSDPIFELLPCIPLTGVFELRWEWNKADTKITVKAIPLCEETLEYGTYCSDKAIKADGTNNFLLNEDFSYDNSVTGFTVLSCWFADTTLFQDHEYLLNIKDVYQRDVAQDVGTNDIGGASPTSNVATFEDAGDITKPIYIATSYFPDGNGGSIMARAIDGELVVFEEYPTSEWPNWNGTTYDFYMFRRNNGGNRTPGNCGFLQIIDAPLSAQGVINWTKDAVDNGCAKNVIGNFDDILLADFNSEVTTVGNDDVILDLSDNDYHLVLDGFTTNQLDDTHANYCIVDIP